MASKRRTKADLEVILRGLRRGLANVEEEIAAKQDTANAIRLVIAKYEEEDKALTQ